MTVVRRWWVVALAVAGALALVVVLHPGPLPGEVDYVRWWQRLGEPVPTIADVVRFTTSTEAALVVFGVPMLWVVVRGGRSGRIAVAVALATMLVAQPVLKEIVDRPRPTPDQVEVRADYESKSFPSGHSMSTTTVWGATAAVLWTHGRRRWAAVAAGPIALTSVASAVQGVHWPSDSIAGLLIGAVAAGAITTQLSRGPFSPRGRTRDRLR
jgi:membrane-associated phospholipid phosphatase